MPNLQDLKEYNEEKNQEAKDYYYQEYKQGGAFRENVLKVKAEKSSDNFELLGAWYRNKMDTVSAELEGAKTDKEASVCQNKMLAYFQIFQENMHDFYDDYRKEEAKKGNNIVFFSTPKNLLPLRQGTAKKFKVYEGGQRSFEKQVDRNKIFNMEANMDKIAQEEAKDKASKEVSDKKREYAADIYGKYRELQEKYNKAFKTEQSIMADDWSYAVRNAKTSPSFQSKKVSIMDMVDSYRKDVVDEQEKRIGDMENEYVKDAKTEMEGIMSNVDGHVHDGNYKAGMEKYENGLSDVAIRAHAVAKDWTRSKMTLYAATKKRMDGRGFLSKLFHPTRTKQENAMFATMREDLKNTLGADDNYMKALDSRLSGKKPSFNNFPSVRTERQLRSVDYSSKVKEQAELFGQKQLASQLDKAFNPQAEKTQTVGLKGTAPQMQQTGPKIE